MWKSNKVIGDTMKRIIGLALPLMIVLSAVSCSVGSPNAPFNQEASLSESTIISSEKGEEINRESDPSYGGEETSTLNGEESSSIEIEVDGTKYRNGFLPGLSLTYDEGNTQLVQSEALGECYLVKQGNKQFLVCNSNDGKTSAENVYCKSSDWKSYRSFYSSAENYDITVSKITNGKEKITDIKDVNLIKLIDLISFCDRNRYDDFSSTVPKAAYAVAYKLADSPKYRISINSKDGLVLGKSSDLMIISEKISLIYHIIMSENKALIIDIPSDLNKYFMNVLKNET